MLSIRKLACVRHHSPTALLIEPSVSQPTVSLYFEALGLSSKTIKMHYSIAMVITVAATTVISITEEGPTA